MPRHREYDEQQVIDRALEAFWSGSYAATSTRDLCDSTGLSRSSLYNGFADKSEVYRRSLERYGERMGLERSAYLDRAGSGREVLSALLTDVLGSQCERADRRGCMVLSAAVELGGSDPAVAALARSNLDAFSAVLAQLIARGQQDGSITATAPAAELARVVHATLNGLQVSARVADDPAAPTEALHTLLSLL